MGTVFRARQDTLKRQVALKVLSPDLATDSKFVTRFMREARVLAMLEHPNIVTIHDVGAYEGHHYISMEYLKGGNLQERIKAGQSTEQIVRWCIDLAAALSYLHSKKIVHRDIKPDNIMFRHDSCIVLTDFGVAKSQTEQTPITEFGSVIGTPAYLSPEQIRGKEPDARSDLYSMGILLFYMLSGDKPFRGEPAQVLQQQLSHPLPELPAAKASLQQILDRLTAKNPLDRFQTAAELKISLENWLDGEKRDSVPASVDLTDLAQSGKRAWTGLMIFDAQKEGRFQREHAKFSAQLLRIALPLGIFLYLSFFLWDMAQPGNEPIIAFSIRFSFALVLVLMALLTFTQLFERHAQAVIFTTSFLSVLGVAVILFLVPDGFLHGYGGICVTLIFGSVLTGMQFKTALVFSVIALILTNSLLVNAEHTLPLNYILINTNFFFFSVALIGTLSAYYVEFSQRLRFDESGTIGTIKMPWTTGSQPLRSTPRNRVFICYRRTTSQDLVGRICDRLEHVFGEKSVLKDVDIVPLGVDYRTFLGRMIKQSNVMLVIIGEDWMSAHNASTANAGTDAVLSEIELALNLGIPIIPVLVKGQSMPLPQNVPDSISPLLTLSAANIRTDPDFEGDMEKLVSAIASLSPVELTKATLKFGYVRE